MKIFLVVTYMEQEWGDDKAVDVLEMRRSKRSAQNYINKLERDGWFEDHDMECDYAKVVDVSL